MIPTLWRITVEYETAEQARMAAQLLRSTAPRLYELYIEGKAGEPLWNEHGLLQLRPQDGQR
jgi:hypothetical protein